MKQFIIAKSNAVVTKFEELPVKRSPELQIGKYYRKGKVLNTSINTTLRKIDPKGARFGLYVFTTTTKVADAVTVRRIQRALNGEQKEELQEENEQAVNNCIQEKVAMIREHSHWKERAIEEIDKLKEVIDELKVKLNNVI